MKLKVTQTYYDKKESKYVDKDAIIDRDDIRAELLVVDIVLSTGYDFQQGIGIRC